MSFLIKFSIHLFNELRGRLSFAVRRTRGIKAACQGFKVFL